jgi:hypothetical protein
MIDVLKILFLPKNFTTTGKCPTMVYGRHLQSDRPIDNALHYMIEFGPALCKLALFTATINFLLLFISCAAYTSRSTKYYTAFVLVVTQKAPLQNTKKFLHVLCITFLEMETFSLTSL